MDRDMDRDRERETDRETDMDTDRDRGKERTQTWTIKMWRNYIKMRQLRKCTTEQSHSML
jgi:hypothetical protein